MRPEPINQSERASCPSLLGGAACADDCYSLDRGGVVPGVLIHRSLQLLHDILWREPITIFGRYTIP
jgi:hypothetical protein